ncbi:transposase [Xenorhabdus khoisanae]|uniref:transposase n=1 Tax=Xenorhabdus khoisanae TaxID=880157 RepID=UPI0023596E4B|nr:transposase [Xenorhabdus khoisanae]MDC9616119.1 transposase [Xenorhabdus khoisanae]
MKNHQITRRHFSPTFRLEAVEQVIQFHQKPVDVARSLDIDPSLLRKWMKQYHAELQGVTSRGQAMTPEQRRIKELEAQVKQLEMEKTILKQAAVLMSEMPNKFIRSSHS